MRSVLPVVVLLSVTACGRHARDDGDGGVGQPPIGLEDGGVVVPFCASAPFPTPCNDADATPVSTPGFSTWGSVGPSAVQVDTVANPHPMAPRDVAIYRPSGQTNVPVLFFSHAFGATDPRMYDDLFRMLASNGYAVVQVAYPIVAPKAHGNADRYDCLWQGFQAAVAREGAVFDLTRVGFFGHSYGGGATPEMARRGFVEKGWGSAGRFFFSMAPWYGWGTQLDTLPLDVKVAVQVYADDDVNDHQIAIRDVWNQLPAGLERVWMTVRSDACGCGLNATHVVPISFTGLSGNPESVLNAQDRWAVWRRLHAMAVYAFTQNPSAKQVVFGSDVDMGHWFGCDGRAVRPMEVSLTTPLPAPCRAYMYPLSAREAYADTSP